MHHQHVPSICSSLLVKQAKLNKLSLRNSGIYVYGEKKQSKEDEEENVDLVVAREKRPHRDINFAKRA